MILGIPQVGATSYGDGTSYATPIVTAAAAILMGKHPEWDVATVRRAILETARQVEGLDERCQTGGMLDLKAALEWAP
jgi:subtilisin family serine protease